MMEPYFDNGVVRLYQSDARAIPLADKSVHCVVTSPPYYGLRIYADNDDRGIGVEASVEEYIANMVDVFREVWRVLRDDGVAWLNIGDSYAGGGDLSSGNRMGVPEQVVMALQADGWTWRDTIIWHKKSAMPESVVGWRWERCRVKLAERPPRGDTMEMGRAGGIGALGVVTNTNAEWADCDGCPKCDHNDGLVLRQGSWRTTQAHEYIYMLTKGMGYYADGEAVKMAALQNGTGMTPGLNDLSGGVNRRSVWSDISPEPYGGSHFATFPSGLPRICIQASTSERGCCSWCGAQYARVVESSPIGRTSSADGTENDTPFNNNPQGPKGYVSTQTLGFRPTCGCDAPSIPTTVLDPFNGAATTCIAAQRLGRRAVGTDISREYLEQSVKRLSGITLPMTI